jgi:hypothetical protein
MIDNFIPSDRRSLEVQASGADASRTADPGRLRDIRGRPEPAGGPNPRSAVLVRMVGPPSSDHTTPAARLGSIIIHQVGGRARGRGDASIHQVGDRAWGRGDASIHQVGDRAWGRGDASAGRCSLASPTARAGHDETRVRCPTLRSESVQRLRGLAAYQNAPTSAEIVNAFHITFHQKTVSCAPDRLSFFHET